jgi:hypothetical protein
VMDRRTASVDPTSERVRELTSFFGDDSFDASIALRGGGWEVWTGNRGFLPTAWN